MTTSEAKQAQGGARFTPGPWRVSWVDGAIWRELRDGEVPDRGIGSAPEFPVCPPPKKAADAALIAAAPELYEALAQVEVFLAEHFGHANAPYVPFAHTALNAARAALAKAEGR